MPLRIKASLLAARNCLGTLIRSKTTLDSAQVALDFDACTVSSSSVLVGLDLSHGADSLQNTALDSVLDAQDSFRAAKAALIEACQKLDRLLVRASSELPLTSRTVIQRRRAQRSSRRSGPTLHRSRSRQPFGSSALNALTRRSKGMLYIHCDGLYNAFGVSSHSDLAASLRSPRELRLLAATSRSLSSEHRTRAQRLVAPSSARPDRLG